AGTPPPAGGRMAPGRSLALAFYRLEAPPPRMSLRERQEAVGRREAGEPLFRRRYLPELSSDGSRAPRRQPARLATTLLYPAGPWVPPVAVVLAAAAALLAPTRERRPLLLLGALAAASLLAGGIGGGTAASAAAGMAVRVAGWAGFLSLLLAGPAFPGRSRAGCRGEVR
ncbi:MAG: hypothetical protein ACP5VN_08110, partial [Acidobacteriota bacterium]